MASGSSLCFMESDSDLIDGYLTDEEQSSSGVPSASKKPRLSHSKTNFNLTWTKKHPCIVRVSGQPGKAYCMVCSKSFSVCHQGYRDVQWHMNGSVHQSRSRDVTQTRKITDNFVSEKDDVATKVTSAEVKFAAFLLEHNLPIATADHAGPLFRSMFPDSKVASYYGCARTKTTSIINRALASEFSSSVIRMVQTQPFTLSLDGSNDQEEQKLVPLTVRVFDADLGKVAS